MNTNRVWTVRNEMGVEMFHVYAPDMATARQRAAANLVDLGYPLTAEFGAYSVHALRDWTPETLDHTKLLYNTYPTLSDYPEGI